MDRPAPDTVADRATRRHPMGARQRRTLPILACGLIAATAQASTIGLTLDATAASGAPGSTLTFFGEITNNTGGSLNASDFFFNFSGFDALSITPNQDLAVTTADFPIPTGTTTGSLDLFSVVLAATPAGNSFPLQVQLQDTPGDVTATQLVTVNVTPVPLADGLGYLTMGLLLGGALLRRCNPSIAHRP